MRILHNCIIIFCILNGGLWGQLKSQLPDQNAGAMITGNNISTTVPLLDPSRFNMQHNFSMSTISLGGQAMNVAAYTNMMTYELNPNLHLGTSFSLIQPTGMMGPGNYGLNKTKTCTQVKIGIQFIGHHIGIGSYIHRLAAKRHCRHGKTMMNIEATGVQKGNCF